MAKQLSQIQHPLRVIVKRSDALNNSLFLMQNASRRLGVGNEPTVSVPSADEPKKYFLSVMVRAKNEGRFLLEWLAHHKAIGVDHVYIYDNGSDDNTAEVLAKAVEAGFVTHVDWPNKPITPSAEIDFFKRFAKDSEWTAFIDADEFIRVRSNRSLREVLEATKAPALAMNWRIFGTSNLEEPEDGNMLGSLTWSADNLHRQLKVIARNAEVAKLRNSHNFYYRDGRLARTAEGRRAFGTYVAAPRGAEVEVQHYTVRGRTDTSIKAGNKVSVEGHHYERESQFDHAMNNDINNPLPADHLAKVRAIFDAWSPAAEAEAPTGAQERASSS